MLWTVAFVVGAALSLFLHELSHAVMVWARGGRVLSFRPFPSRRDGRWFFGYVRYIDARPSRWIHGSPAVKSLAMTLVWSTLGLVCPYVWMLAAWEAIDHAWWWKGYFSGDPALDGTKFRTFSRSQ